MKTRLAPALFLAAAFSTAAFTSSLAANHDQHPKIISMPAPAYAFDLRKAGIEGAVLVSFTITAQGAATDAVVLESTDRVFEAPTLAAVKAWRFTPASHRGLAVSVTAIQLIVFKAADRNPETPDASLVKNLKRHPAAPGLSVVNATSTDLCYCESRKVFNDCHGADAFRRLASEGKLITAEYSGR